MTRDVSFMQYLRAHGNTAGPTQRPYLTGAIGGLLAYVPYELMLQFSGAQQAISRGFGIDTRLSLGLSAFIMVAAGVLYAAVFKRAANDSRGGWLFGASFGFLLWMIAPVTLWQLIAAQPIAVGGAAIGLFAGHVLFGIVLGLVFPWIHMLLQSELNDEIAPVESTRLTDHAKCSKREVIEWK